MLCLRRHLGTRPELRTLYLDVPDLGRIRVLVDYAPPQYGETCVLVCVDAPDEVVILRAELAERTEQARDRERPVNDIPDEPRQPPVR